MTIVDGYNVIGTRGYKLDDETIECFGATTIIKVVKKASIRTNPDTGEQYAAHKSFWYVNTQYVIKQYKDDTTVKITETVETRGFLGRSEGDWGDFDANTIDNYSEIKTELGL